MKTEITHKLIGITALILTASFISTAVQAATVTIDSLTYKTNENGTASVTDCLENFTGAVTIPSSITVDGTAYTVTDIGWNAFYWCTKLTEIIIPDSVTSIGSSAFYNCTKLTEIIIPDSVTSIGSNAFCSCTSLTNVILPDSVNSIGDYAFASCNSLTEIQVSENNSSYQSIEGILFSKDGTLLHTYPKGKTNSSYIIPDSVSSIAGGAFEGCTSLTEVIIPDSVTSIGDSAFYYCKSLSGIYFQSQTPPKVGFYVFSYCPSNMIIYYPEGAEANWGTEWQGFVTAPWDPAVGPAPEEPSLTCGTVSKNPETGEISFTLTFTGTLQESADGITWSDISDAVKGSYTVTVQKNQNRFFRAVVK